MGLAANKINDDQMKIKNITDTMYKISGSACCRIAWGGFGGSSQAFQMEQKMK